MTIISGGNCTVAAGEKQWQKAADPIHHFLPMLMCRHVLQAICGTTQLCLSSVNPRSTRSSGINPRTHFLALWKGFGLLFSNQQPPATPIGLGLWSQIHCVVAQPTYKIYSRKALSLDSFFLQSELKFSTNAV